MLKLFDFLRDISSGYYENPLVPRFYRFVEYVIACISLNELFLLWCITLGKLSHLIWYVFILLFSILAVKNTFVLHFSYFSMQLFFIFYKFYTSISISHHHHYYCSSIYINIHHFRPATNSIKLFTIKINKCKYILISHISNFNIELLHVNQYFFLGNITKQILDIFLLLFFEGRSVFNRIMVKLWRCVCCVCVCIF